MSETRRKIEPRTGVVLLKCIANIPFLGKQKTQQAMAMSYI